MRGRWLGIVRRIVIGACVVPLSVAAAGCVRDANPDLALSCQVQDCVCRSERPPVFSRPLDAEVLWKDNGDAYCKPGWVLRRAEP